MIYAVYIYRRRQLVSYLGMRQMCISWIKKCMRNVTTSILYFTSLVALEVHSLAAEKTTTTQAVMLCYCQSCYRNLSLRFCSL